MVWKGLLENKKGKVPPLTRGHIHGLPPLGEAKKNTAASLNNRQSNREFILKINKFEGFYEEKQYDIYYKKQAVQLCKEEGQAIAQTARNLVISYKTLHRWCNECTQSKGAGFVASIRESRLPRFKATEELAI
ncbi:helix-turn-helix domain-containing protein [Bacillus wiedmannii]|uniref:helix-turn-helix domain-containing protein n=1 Tax=Bacillus wiedmannii TaxID=1890302 RepID=UPI000BEF97D9|nr:helix-turn-helix domain-containing protein [Bacillus wiedmannii]PEO39967.1 hypothetical protein CN555_06415 [Bacillus wiedmannii]